MKKILVTILAVALALNIASCSTVVKLPTPTPTQMPSPTSTFTPGPTLTPTPAPTPEVLDSFDFSDPKSWGSNSSKDGWAGAIENGTYKITLDHYDGWYYARPNDNKNFDDVSISVDITPVMDPTGDAHYGIACRENDVANNFYDYEFYVTTDGHAGIMRNGAGSSHYISGYSLEQADFKLDPTKPTRLRADCIGNTFGLYVNNELVASAQDNTYRLGYAGIVADTPGRRAKTEIDFNNFVVIKNTTPVLVKKQDYPSGTIILNEDFSTTRNGWSVGDNPGKLHTDLEINNNKLQMTLYKAETEQHIQPNMGEVDDVLVKVNATRVNGPYSGYGILCHYEWNPEQYDALIVFSTGAVRIGHYENNNWTTLGTGSAPSSVFHQGYATNTIQAECSKTTLALTINGTPVLSVQSASKFSSDFGLLAKTIDFAGKAEIDFDSLTVSVP